MLDVLLRAGCFGAIIFLGIVLRKGGFFKEEDFRLLSGISIKLSLPAAIITYFACQQIDFAKLAGVLIGLGGGVL